jgi:hypothetical protein
VITQGGADQRHRLLEFRRLFRGRIEDGRWDMVILEGKAKKPFIF